MTRVLTIVVLALAAAAGGVLGGYWLGQHGLILPDFLSAMAPARPQAQSGVKTAPAAVDAPEPAIVYYRDPSGKPDYSPTPKADDQGRDFLPVYAEEEAVLFDSEQAAQPEKKTATILYYRNPKGLPDVSPVPKKDSMGMDYIAVYDDEADAPDDTVKVSLDKVQRIGVRTARVERRDLSRPIRAVGSIQFDERRLAVVTTRFDGWIERLRVSATGQGVARGQALMEVYSPDLIQAEQEYVLALNALERLADAAEPARAAANRLVQGALSRLANFDLPAAELDRLARERTASRVIVIPSPFNGVVVEKPALLGMRFMRGEPLFKLADMSSMWALVEVYEQDLARVAVGQDATITVNAYPDRRFSGRVAFIYPTIGRETRTATIRVELANPGGLLKADMYVVADLAAPAGGRQALTVPDSAVIDSGTRQVVLVERGAGLYQPREVTLGARGEGYVEVLDGLVENETVVDAATFLIDAESNLKAALRAFAAPESRP